MLQTIPTASVGEGGPPVRTVLCLGGTGPFGLPVARLLAADVERFGRDYLALVGPELAGLDLFSRQVLPA